MKHIHWIMKLSLLAALASTQQGCVDAAVTGAQVALNHDHIQKTLNDQYITTQAYRKIYKDNDHFADANISIATFHQKVLLAGQVASPAEKKAAEQLIKDIPDVERVYNVTEVTPASSALIRMSDTWITAKIKSRLIATNDIDPSQIKVVTENGTVYLMGTLLTDQANVVTDIARTTNGVQNVVKIFTYLQIAKS